jgi:threonine dehydrogenase-like Zn-dependent dehydrogenase
MQGALQIFMIDHHDYRLAFAQQAKISDTAR